MNPVPNVIKSIIRGLTPWAIATAASAIAHFGYHVSPATTIQILAGAGAVLTALLHALEARFPWVGVFLGYLGAPLYAPSKGASQRAQIDALQAEVDALRASAYEAKTRSPETAAGVPSTYTPPPAP